MNMNMYRCNLLLKVYIPAKYQRDMTNNNKEIEGGIFSYFTYVLPWPLTYDIET